MVKRTVLTKRTMFGSLLKHTQNHLFDTKNKDSMFIKTICGNVLKIKIKALLKKTMLDIENKIYISIFVKTQKICPSIWTH